MPKFNPQQIVHHTFEVWAISEWWKDDRAAFQPVQQTRTQFAVFPHLIEVGSRECDNSFLAETKLKIVFQNIQQSFLPAIIQLFQPIYDQTRPIA